MRSRSPDELREELDGTAPYVAKLLPELRQSLPDITEPPALDPEAERYRLFEGVSDFLLNVAVSKPLLLFLDDLHWADDATLLLLEHLARRLPEASLLVIGTYRDVEVHDQHPLASLLAELSRQHLDSRITLRPFGREEAAALVEAVIGETPASHVLDALYDSAAGNPFFTEELVRHLQEQGRDLADPQAAVGDWAIPESIRQVVGKRLARLGAGATQVLAYSSVLGRALSLYKVAAVTGKDEDSLLDLLDEALSARLLQEEGQGYAFAHPLIRETLYQGLSGPRRRQLHRRVGEAMEVLYAANLEPHLAELAHHFFQEALGGDVDKAIDYAVRAGERATIQLAYEEAAGQYQRALQALELQEPADKVQRCELLLALGEARWREGDIIVAGETFMRAADVARELGAPEQLARAALGLDIEYGAQMGTVDDEQVRLLREVLSALGVRDSGLRSRVLARLARGLYWSNAAEEKRLLSQEAVETARRVGDTAALAYAMRSRHLALWGPGNVEDRLAVATECLRLAEDVGDKWLALEGHRGRIIDLLELGDIPEVDRDIEAYARLADELRQPLSLWQTAAFRAMRALLDGRFDQGERLTQQALAVGQQRRGAGDVVVGFGVQMLLLRREQGRLQELEAAAKGFAQQYPAVPVWRSALAWLYSELGREAEARSEFDRLAASDFTDLPQDWWWLITVAHLSEACAFLGDAHRAAILYELLLPYARRNVVVPGFLCIGSCSRSLGLLATTMARWEEAARHFEDALEMHSRMGARPWLAHSQHEYAAMLVARGQPENREKALVLLEAAIATFRELGMPADLQRAEELEQKLAEFEGRLG